MPEDITIMIVDGGARGHVLSEAYENDPRVKRIVVAPGNDFVGHNRQKDVVIAKDCSLKDPNSLLAVAQKYKPDLVDVAQDDALDLDTVGLLRANGFPAFGPTRKETIIESSKIWSRGFMLEYDIPSPAFATFSSVDQAVSHLKVEYEKNPDKLLFQKANGLCGGKGALKSRSLKEGIENVRRMKDFGEAGSCFLIEDGIVRKDGSTGEEFSYVVITDGKTYQAFKPAQDNKLAENFDKGEQTGGMGANAPALVVTRELANKIKGNIISRAIAGMSKEGRPYVGILYVGGMEADGEPVVIEFNARPGDPEAQVMWPGVTNYPEMVLKALDGKLDEVRMADDTRYRWCVVGASRGYPGPVEKGKRIYGLKEAAKLRGVKIYGAGIAVQDGKFYTNGGGLFSVVGERYDPLTARQLAYEAMSYINIEGNNLQFRTDIGWRDTDRFLGNPSIYR